MKKIIAFVLLFVLVFSLAACGSTTKSKNDNSNKSVSQTKETESVDSNVDSKMKDFVFGSLKMTLPSDFTQKNDLLPEDSDMEYLFTDRNQTIAVVALKELKSEFKGTEVKSLDDYLKVQRDNSKGIFTSVINEDNGLKYFEYTALSNALKESVTYEYFSTAYETDDEYWFIQITTLEDNYKSLQSDFIKWAHSITKA